MKTPVEQPSGVRPQLEGYALIGLGVAARAIGLATGTVAGVLTVVLAVRLLGPSSYGVFAFGLSTAVVFAGVGRLGLEPAVARAVALVSKEQDADERAEIARGALTLVALTGVAGALATFLVVGFGTKGLDQGTRVILGVSFGLVLYSANVAAVAGALTRGAGHVGLMELPNLAATLARLGAVALLAALGIDKVGWLAAGFAGAAVVGLVMSRGVMRVVLRSSRARAPHLPAARGLLSVALPFAVTGLAVIVISRFDVIVLGLSGSSADVGEYEPVLRIVEQAMLLVPLLFTAQFLPVATRAFTAGDQAGFDELYVNISKLVFVVSFPAIVLLAAFPETVLHALYGADFPARGLIVWLLLTGFVVNLALGLNTSALAAAGSRLPLARSGIVATASMIVLAFALIPSYGATGAAISTSATYVVFNLWVSVELHRATGAHPLRPDLLLVIVTATVPVAVALVVRSRLEPSSLWGALLWSCVVTLGWIGLLLATRLLRREELRRLLPW